MNNKIKAFMRRAVQLVQARRRLINPKAAAAPTAALILLGFVAFVAVSAWEMFWRMIIDAVLVASVIMLWRELSDLGSICDIKASRLEERLEERDHQKGKPE